MQSPKTISAALQRRADDHYERKRRKQIQPLRGLRGVKASDVVAVLVRTWHQSPAQLPHDLDALHRLFSTAFEDGLVAIGLLSAALPDAPLEALDQAERWLEMVDDSETADALGWLLLGPALLASGEPFAEALEEIRKEERVMKRRTAVMATMAAMPAPLEGPAAAALRERSGQRRLAFVEAPLDDLLHASLPPFIRDEDPHVRKATARALRTWGMFSPDRVEEILNTFRGGVPKFIRQEVERGIRKGRRDNKT